MLLVIALAVQAAAPAPAACATLEHRQFDFWVGDWDVYRTDTDQLIARSLIEKLYAGCAVRENWMPVGGTGGGSLNSWRPAEMKWRQTWTDSGNNWNEYAGGIEGGLMVLTGTSAKAGGTRVPARMTYEAKADGSVVQTGYQSSDGGKSWSLTYQYAYRPAAPSSK